MNNFFKFNFGSKYWWNREGPHRLDGPAIEYMDRKEWYICGDRHRIDGPAYEGPDKRKD